MNKHLYDISIRNIKKYKKHYILFALIISFIVAGMITFIQITTINRDIKDKAYCKEYGTYNELRSKLPIAYLDDFNQYWKENPVGTVGFIYYENDDLGSITEGIDELFGLEIDGKKPSDDHEVMIIKEYADELDYHKGSHIQYGNDTYTVVGIVSTYNHYDMPSIIKKSVNATSVSIVNDTTQYWLTNGSTIIDEKGNEIEIEPVEVIISGRGRDLYSNRGILDDSLFDLMIIFESVVLGSFVLSMLTATTLKKRSKEMALLRGIGMTNGQLRNVLLAEVTAIITAGILTGAIVGISASYVVNIIANKMTEFTFNRIPIQEFIQFCILFMITAILFSLRVVSKSSNQALSGAFNGEKFKYFNGRTDGLKKQSFFNIAKRELSVNKLFTVSFFLFNFVIGSYFSLNMMHNLDITLYNENYEDENNELVVPNYDTITYDQNNRPTNIYKHSEEELSQFDIPSIRIYSPSTTQDILINIHNSEIKNHYNDCMTIYKDDGGLEYYLKEGRLPSNNKEILISRKILYMQIDVDELDQPFDKNDEKVIYHNKAYEVASYNEDNDVISQVVISIYVNVGDEVSIDGQKLMIVGRIDHPEYPQDKLCISDQISFKHFKKDEDFETIVYPFKDNALKKDIAKQFMEKDIYYYCNGYPVASQKLGYAIDARLLLIPIIVGICLGYYVYSDYLRNNLENDRIYRLIGMTNDMLIKKQFYKAVVLTLLTLIAMFTYLSIVIVGFKISYFPIKELLIIGSVCFVAYSLIYILPMYFLIKDHKLDLDQKYE